MCFASHSYSKPLTRNQYILLLGYVSYIPPLSLNKGCMIDSSDVSRLHGDIRGWLNIQFSLRSDHISSVAQSCPTLCDSLNRSTPGLPVHHQLPEFTQTHVHRVGDAIQPSHPLSSPSPPAPNPSQHQSLFQ